MELFILPILYCLLITHLNEIRYTAKFGAFFLDQIFQFFLVGWKTSNQISNHQKEEKLKKKKKKIQQQQMNQLEIFL